VFRRQRKELKIKIPKKVKIGAITYKVTIYKEIPNKESALGHTSYEREVIQLAESKPDCMFNTFLHEVLHCFNYESDDLKIQNLADRLHDFIKDNPRIFK